MAQDLLLGKTKRDWSRDDSVGSLLLPAAQQKVLMNKVDDVRFDIRSAKNIIGAAIFALSGAIGFMAIAKIYKITAKEKQGR